MKFTVLALLLMFASTSSYAKECVVLLHGLARTSASMKTMQSNLENEGYFVANVDYPSRAHAIEKLSSIAVSAGLKRCADSKASPVNFVTHSLGGILVRHYLEKAEITNLNRVVMLGPPNQGSEVVDNLKHVPGFRLLNGPAGMQLGTDNNSIPRNLQSVNFKIGIIAGTQSINLILSSFLPNPDDGKVSVESTKVEGMCSFTALPTTHPFMMKNKTVIKEVITFLKSGNFESEAQTAKSKPHHC